MRSLYIIGPANTKIAVAVFALFEAIQLQPLGRLMRAADDLIDVSPQPNSLPSQRGAVPPGYSVPVPDSRVKNYSLDFGLCMRPEGLVK
jgi:hypothetical protein